MNTKNSFNTNKFSLNIIRFLIVLLIYSSSLKIDTIFTVSNWKIYFFILFIWFLIEMNLGINNKESYLTFFFCFGLIKLFLVLFSQNFDLSIFYSAPDSIPLRDLGKTIFECFDYSRSCGGDPYFQRGPSYSILISIFTLGTKISALFLILIQIFLFAYINAGIIKKIDSNNNWVTAAIFILLTIYPSIATFSRIVLYEIWGVFCLFLAWKFSDLETTEKKYYIYYLLLLGFSIYLQIQYFLVIFLFFLKFSFFNKYNSKHIFTGILIPIILIISWGFRNETHLGYWDFNPYSGCYLERNIIEPTEALKRGVSNNEIRTSRETLVLIGRETKPSNLNDVEICKEFLDIMPSYYIENFETIFENYKIFISKFFTDHLTCQYEEIGCERGYWFFIINKLFNYLLIVCLLCFPFLLNKKELINFLIFASLLILITALVTIDVPRMRISIDIYLFYLVGITLNKIEFFYSQKRK